VVTAGKVFFFGYKDELYEVVCTF